MPRKPAVSWDAEQDEMLCTLRSDFPVETFETIAWTLTAAFGIPRTRNACIARWHHIEAQDELEVRKAMAHAELRAAAKQARVECPPLPQPPPLPVSPVEILARKAAQARVRRAEKRARKHALIQIPSAARMLAVQARPRPDPQAASQR